MNKKAIVLSRQIIMSSTCFILLNFGIVCAAPANELEVGAVAGGLSSGDKSNTYYLESRTGETFTLGVEYCNWRKQLGKTTDIYGKIDLDNATEDFKIQVLVGNRTFNDASDASRKFAGAEVSSNLAENLVAYSSFIIGKGFDDFQIGTLYHMSMQNDLNIAYHYNRYEDAKNDLSFGINFKF